MAEAGIAAVFENLNAQLGGLSTVMKAQGVAQIVTPYDGDPKKFKDWIKSIEKYASLTGIEGDGIKAVAFQSSKGCVSDFIQRRKELPAQREHPDTWPQLKAELSKRFAEVTDSAHALLLLRKIKQRPGEGVQIFAERLLTLAEDAYAGLGDNSLEAVERQLIGFFVDGLTHDYMKLKIIIFTKNVQLK